MVFVTNKIKQEMKTIEIPSELHKHSKMGILQAKSEMRKSRRKTPKFLPYLATAACLAILTTIGLSLHTHTLQKQADQKISAEDHPKIIHYTHPKSANKVETENQGQDNQQLQALDNLTLSKPEFTNFKVFLRVIDQDKNKDVSHYDTDIASCYVYPKYFMQSETDPEIKADEISVMEQDKKVILSNHAKKDVDRLKALISKLNGKYKNYSADGSYKGLIGNYKKIADLAKNYKLPKSGIVSRSSHPSWYGLDPNEVVYTNGYQFNKKTGQNTGIVVPKGKTLQSEKPTKGQYLGVIEEKINGLAGQVEDPSDVSGFGNNRKDIHLKINEINEAEKYTGQYPLIQSELDQIKSTLHESERNGLSEQSLQKAISLYHEAVLNGQKLYHAIQVGQELRNTAN